MHEADINRVIEGARKIADGLAEAGRAADAELIRSLCRSRTASRETNRRLKLDNDALRGGGAVPRMMLIGNEHAVCCGGRWDGWLFVLHPDGQWVSKRKLPITFMGGSPESHHG